MGVILEQSGERFISAREQHIFFVVETSSALQGEPILEINNAIRAALEELKKVNEDGIELCIGILEYNDIARWSECRNKARKLDYLRDFIWEDLDIRGGRRLCEALETLERGLSRKTKMESAGGNYRPIVVFISDGHSHDDWERGLQVLSENKWYKYALKVAFAIGWNPCKDVLKKIVTVGIPGIVQTVRYYEDLPELTQIAVMAAVTGNLTACRYGPAVENREVSIVIMNEIVDALRQAGYEAVYHDKTGEDSANALRGVDMLQLDSSDDYDFGEFV